MPGSDYNGEQRGMVLVPNEVSLVHEGLNLRITDRNTKL